MTTPDEEARRAERIRLGGMMAALGGGYTVDTAPDDVTPYRTEDGGWSTRALERYLDQQLVGDVGEETSSAQAAGTHDRGNAQVSLEQPKESGGRHRSYRELLAGSLMRLGGRGRGAIADLVLNLLGVALTVGGGVLGVVAGRPLYRLVLAGLAVAVGLVIVAPLAVRIARRL